MNESRDLVKFDPKRYLLLKTDQEKLDKVIQKTFRGKRLRLFDLPMAKVPSGGGANWKMVPPAGDAPKELKGVILDIAQWRAFWQIPFDQSGGGSPPDCTSMDTIEGYGNRGLDDPEDELKRHDCLTCPHAKWGSDTKSGRGQRCKEMRVIMLLTESSILPLVVLVPPTSLKSVDGFAYTMAGQIRELHENEVLMRLKPERNKDGIEYSKIELQIGDPIPEEFAAKIENWLKIVKAGSVDVTPRDLQEDAVA